MPKATIALVNEGGQVIGGKLRSALASTDVYHGIFVLLITPAKQLVLSVLPGAPQKLGATCMAIRLAGESAEESARRALPMALPLHHLGDRSQVLGDRTVYTSVFYGVGTLPAGNDQHTALKLAELDARLAAGDAALTPAFAGILTAYRHMLPL